MRYGFDGGSEKTLAEIGLSFALTRERIRQIESEALRKLRIQRRARKLAR
jgi:RNA polymerase primary sigma factor